MGHAPIRAAGHVLRHAVGVLLLSWLRALRAGCIAGLVGVLVVELAAVVMTQRFPPDGNAQLVAVVLAFALAFGAAATVIADEILEGIRDLIGMLAGEAESGARVATTLAEREVGESSAKVLRLVGLGRLLDHQSEQPAQPPATATPAVRLTATSAPSSGVFTTREWTARTSDTLEELANEPTASSPVRPDAMPVPADQLPRLTWTDEMPAVRPPGPAAQTPAPRGEPAEVAPPETSWEAASPDLAAHTEADDLSLEASSAEPAAVDEPAATLPFIPPAEELAAPSQWHASEAGEATDFEWHDPSLAAEPQDDEESYIQPIDVFGEPPPRQPTQQDQDESPVSPPPANEDSAVAEDPPAVGPRGSVWDHISQVLAGRPVVPLPEDPEPDVPDERESSSAQ
jgi:hypothetical protein